MITRAEFAQMVREVLADPTDIALESLMDDWGYVEILANLAKDRLDAFVGENGDEPVAKDGKINWPSGWDLNEKSDA